MDFAKLRFPKSSYRDAIDKPILQRYAFYRPMFSNTLQEGRQDVGFIRKKESILSPVVPSSIITCIAGWYLNEVSKSNRNRCWHFENSLWVKSNKNKFDVRRLSLVFPDWRISGIHEGKEAYHHRPGDRSIQGNRKGIAIYRTLQRNNRGRESYKRILELSSAKQDNLWLENR